LKIQLLSDVHCETRQYWVFNQSMISKEAELVIIPGDFHYLHYSLDIIHRALYDHQQCLYVPGNHEYYHLTMTDAHRKLNKQLQSKSYPVHVLNNKSIKIQGVLFMGSTLWTDYDLFNNYNLAVMTANLYMNDFRVIHSKKNVKWSTTLAHAAHIKSLTWLGKELSKKAHKKVVITHHGPSVLSSPEKYRTQILSASFASNLEEFMLQYQPDFWFHGHTHNQTSFTINNTKIMVNAMGYPGEYTGYIPHYLIDLENS
jgi:predicted phosphodiesterase